MHENNHVRSRLINIDQYPDNVPGLIPYGIGTGHHGHTVKSHMGPSRGRYLGMDQGKSTLGGVD